MLRQSNNLQTTKDYLTSGNAYYNQAKYAEAIADYNKAIELNPKDAAAYNNRGNTHKNQGKYAEALADYNKAIELNPKDASTYNNRGLAYYDQAKYIEAIADYNKAIELNPKYALAYINRGDTYHTQGKYTEAIADYTQAFFLIAAHPRDSWYQTHFKNLVNITEYEEKILNYAFSLPSSHEFVKSILTSGTALNEVFYRERGITSPNLTKGTLALVLSRYCQFATSNDAELSLQLANQLYLLIKESTPSLTTVKNYTALLKNALSVDANKQADVFMLIKNSAALTRCVQRESSPEFIGCYMELLNACAKQHMPSSELLDLLEQPLAQGYDHNMVSVISYFKDTKLLTAYASLLTQCADTDANKARIQALLGKKIEGYTLFNIGGGRTLGELLKQHNLSALPSLVKPEMVEPVSNHSKNEMELTTFNTQSIMQSTSLMPAVDALEPVYIDHKTIGVINHEPKRTGTPVINSHEQTLFKTSPKETRLPAKKDPTATEIYAELEALPPPPNTRPTYHRPTTPAKKLGVTS